SACYRQIRLLQANHTISTISKIMRLRRCERHEAEKPEIKNRLKTKGTNMNTSLKNKVALVTGGTSGIGEAAGLQLAKAGAKVVVAGRRESEGQAVVEAIETSMSSKIQIPSRPKSSSA